MAKDLKVSLDHIHIKNDHDGFGKGAGEIYFKYNIDGGLDDAVGQTGITGIHTGDGKPLGEKFDFEIDDVKDQIVINIGVWESDWGKDDHLPKDLNVTYTADQNFGIGQQHTYDTTDYIIKYTIFEV